MSAGTPASAAVTVHRSFRGGIPTSATTARTATGFGSASTGVSVSSGKSAKSVQKVQKGGVPGKALVGTLTAVTPMPTMLLATVRDKGGKRVPVRFDRLTYQASDASALTNAVKLLDTVAKDKEVEVRYDSHDVKGNVQGIVFAQTEQGRVDLNLTLLRNGWARHDVRDKTPVYADAESKAKAARLGLWGQSN